MSIYIYVYRTEDTVHVVGNPFITTVALGSPTSSCLLRPIHVMTIAISVNFH